MIEGRKIDDEFDRKLLFRVSINKTKPRADGSKIIIPPKSKSRVPVTPTLTSCLKSNLSDSS